jgi:hypothetical protein
VLPGAPNYTREFGLSRNSVCFIKRQNDSTQKVAVGLINPPKLGRFGKATIFYMAYRAGNKAGDDYFEYVSTEIAGGGVKRDFRMRNTVHILP